MYDRKIKIVIITIYEGEKMFRYFKSILILLTTIFLLVGCSQSSSKEEEKSSKELTLLINFPTNTLDPHLDTNYTFVRE